MIISLESGPPHLTPGDQGTHTLRLNILEYNYFKTDWKLIGPMDLFHHLGWSITVTSPLVTDSKELLDSEAGTGPLQQGAATEE